MATKKYLSTVVLSNKIENFQIKQHKDMLISKTDLNALSDKQIVVLHKDLKKQAKSTNQGGIKMSDKDTSILNYQEFELR